MPREFVHIQARGPLALVVMDNPKTLNAMDHDLGPQLARGLESLNTADWCRAVVLTGAGGVFSGGGNLARAHEHLQEHHGAGAVFQEYTKWVHRVLAALSGLSRPVVCAVQGASSGAGLGWMLASDFVVCDEDAHLGTGFLGVGLVPGAGVSLTLPRLVGLRRASELLMLAKRFSPQDALTMGLVDELAPADRVLPRALELAAELAQGPAPALADSKALINRAAREGLMVQSEDERRAVMRCADLPDFRRLVERFFQTRG